MNNTLKTTNKKLDGILKNQEVIYDYLQWILYNQSKGRFRFKPSERTLRYLERKYNL